MQDYGAHTMEDCLSSTSCKSIMMRNGLVGGRMSLSLAGTATLATFRYQAATQSLNGLSKQGCLSVQVVQLIRHGHGFHNDLPDQTMYQDWKYEDAHLDELCVPLQLTTIAIV